MDYLATPTTPGPWPAVVVIHEALGLNDGIRAKAERLAGQGYLALCVDLFEGRSMRRCLISAFRQLRAGTGRMFAIIDAGRRGLAERPDCTGQVGVIGFCMGGGFALVAAPSGFDVAAVNYGPLPKNLDDALAGSCAMVASYGGADKSIRNGAAKLERALTDLGIPHDVKEYPGATHAFMSEETPPWITEKLMGLAFDPDATADTWRRIDTFFRTHLLPGPPTAG